MTVLAAPRDPLVDDALQLARVWCAGHTIDGAPALRHAVEVAVTLGRHLREPPPELLAAALLHDSPEFAPAEEDLDELLTDRFGPATTRVVRAVEAAHAAFHQPSPPPADVSDPLTLWVTAADKIVSLGSVVRRSLLAADRAAYWRDRQPFLRLLPHFRAFHSAAALHMPASMAAELGQAVTDAERVGG